MGSRETKIYGTDSLKEIETWLNKKIKSKNIDISWYQSNHEGCIIDKIQEAENSFDGIILNAGALTHYSYSIRDAIASISKPTIEVHMSDIYSREKFRKISVLKEVCISQISGLGKKGYLKALKKLIKNN